VPLPIESIARREMPQLLAPVGIDPATSVIAGAWRCSFRLLDAALLERVAVGVGRAAAPVQLSSARCRDVLLDPVAAFCAFSSCSARRCASVSRHEK
jgi:hypothetical protein